MQEKDSTEAKPTIYEEPTLIHGHKKSNKSFLSTLKWCHQLDLDSSWQESMTRVTGPSLHTETCIIAPKTPSDHVKIQREVLYLWLGPQHVVVASCRQSLDKTLWKLQRTWLCGSSVCFPWGLHGEWIDWQGVSLRQCLLCSSSNSALLQTIVSGYTASWQATVHPSQCLP